MDRLLKPDKLETLPEEPEATKIFDYWFKTFDSFVSTVIASAENRDSVNRLALLTNYLSPQTYAYISEASTYEEAVLLLRSSYRKRKNVTFARHLLMTRSQKQGESISMYVHALRNLAKDCEFQAVSAEKYKEEMTRDAFINGIASEDIRRRLFEEETLDFNTAVKRAEILDLAKQQSELFNNCHGKTNAGLQNQLSSTASTENLSTENSGDSPTVAISQFKRPARKCYFCGGRLHVGGRSNCPAKDKICNLCGKVGHFQKVCLSKEKKNVSASFQETNRLKNFNNQSENSETTLASAPDCLKPTVVNCSLEDVQLDCLLDSGASENFIDRRIAAAIGLKTFGKKTSVSMASKELSTEILGKVEGTLKLMGRTYNKLQLGVVRKLCADIVLGQAFMKQHEEIVFKMGGSRKGLIVAQKLCGVAASHLHSEKLFRNLEPGCRPIATKSRNFNTEDKEFISKEVSKLLNDGVIEPSYSPWRAQVLVTKDERHKRRMVVDYSQTINKFTLLDAYPLPNIDEQVSEIAKGSVFSTLDLKSAYYQLPLCAEDRPYTAFEACGKLYQYTRLPFGVTNGVSYFQRVIDRIIEKYHLNGVYAYVDNITVSGKDKDDHDFKLQALLDAAEIENLTFNNDKCLFQKKQIDLLGYRVSHLKMQPDPERLRPLRDLPLPECKTELKRAIGMFSYYARWISEFSSKIKPLVESNKTNSFPLTSEAVETFKALKSELLKASLTCVDDGLPFTVECDASNHTLAATLNQGGRPVAFHSRTFTPCERRYSTVEKEAVAIIDAIRKWSHYLYPKRFRLVTDQRAVSFLFNPQRLGKIKNTKIQLWRTELGNFDYDIIHKSGKQNAVPDALSRVSCVMYNGLDLTEMHKVLGHPGVTRLCHFVKTKNLPFSIDDVKQVCSNCRICAEVKPRFFHKPPETLIKAMQPWERLSIDFKGPLEGRNKYILFVIDEYSRFPFAFPCKDMSASTVVQCLSNLFSLFGLPLYVHSDRGSSFMSRELKSYLNERGVATSKSTPYHPTGNSQCERINQTVWRTIKLILRNHNQPESSWETALPQSLHAVRSLLCTSTNATPHERFLKFNRRSMLGRSLPSWLLQPGPALLRRFTRNKGEPLVDEVELVDVNPNFARIKFPDGRESTVSVSDLAPCPGSQNEANDYLPEVPSTADPVNSNSETEINEESGNRSFSVDTSAEIKPELRRSSRVRKSPDFYQAGF